MILYAQWPGLAAVKQDRPNHRLVDVAFCSSLKGSAGPYRGPSRGPALTLLGGFRVHGTDAGVPTSRKMLIT